VIRTYKYRLYPTKAQARSLDFLLWQGRNVYNAALEQRIAVYEETGKGVTYPQQWTHFRDERRANPDTLGQLNATSMQQLLRRLDKTFKAFFRRLKAGETPGFPRFKGRHRFNSLEYRYGDGCKLRFDTRNRALFYVQNVGEIKVKYHRLLPNKAVTKHVIIKRRNRKWYVCLQVELPDPVSEEHPGPTVGIDMGLHSLLALSAGFAGKASRCPAPPEPAQKRQSPPPQGCRAGRALARTYRQSAPRLLAQTHAPTG
jgi:putative transposase